MSIALTKYVDITSGVGGTPGDGGAEGDAPQNVQLPFITGPLIVGETATANVGSWSGQPTSFAIRWLIGAEQASADYSYTFEAQDFGKSVRIGVVANNGYLSEESFSLVYGPIGSVVLTAAADVPQIGYVGVLFEGQIFASGGIEPYSYAVQSGALPDGVQLDPVTGFVSGEPTTDATYGPIVVRATDSNGDHADTEPFSVTIEATPVLPDGSVLFNTMPVLFSNMQVIFS